MCVCARICGFFFIMSMKFLIYIFLTANNIMELQCINQPNICKQTQSYAWGLIFFSPEMGDFYMYQFRLEDGKE